MARPLLAVAVLAALLAAGCGGEGGRLSKEAYEDRVDVVLDAISGTFELGPETPPQEVRPELARAADSLRRVEQELAGIEPPAEVESAHLLLAAGVRELAGSLEELASGIEGVDDPVLLSDALAELPRVRGLEQLQEAEREFRDLGYRLGR
jgi:hypothetical protein